MLIVTQATEDGVAICIRDIIEAAASDGYKVTVACPSTGTLAKWAQQRGATWTRLEMRRSPHPSDVMAVARLRNLAKSHALVHLHSSKAGAIGRLALASLGGNAPPSLFTPHGWSWFAGGWLTPAYRLCERTLLPVTTKVVAVSEEERDSGLAVLGHRADRIVVSPNGVDTSRFCPQGQVAPRTSDPLIVSIGRLCHQRGPDVAVAALARMRTPRVRLRLVGDGADKERIENQVRTLGLSARVELTGYHQDPAPDLRAADVVIVPSRYDGLALVLLEAMACGAAIVATKVAGTSALGDAGILVAPDDPESLAKAVDALLTDPQRRQALGLAARARVIERYSLQRSVQGTLKLWRDLGAAHARNHRWSGTSPGPGRSLLARERILTAGESRSSAGESREPITVRAVARIAARQRLASAIAAMMVLFVGLGVVLSRPTVYQSTSSVALLPVASNPGILPNYPNLVASLVPTYVQLVSSPVLLAKVSSTLPFHMSAVQLANNVHAEALSNAAIINIVADSPSPVRAREIAARTTAAFLAQLRGNGIVIAKVYGGSSASKAVGPTTFVLLLLVFALAALLGLAAGLVWDRLSSPVIAEAAHRRAGVRGDDLAATGAARDGTAADGAGGDAAARSEAGTGELPYEVRKPPKLDGAIHVIPAPVAMAEQPGQTVPEEKIGVRESSRTEASSPQPPKAATRRQPRARPDTTKSRTGSRSQSSQQASKASEGGEN